MSEFETPEWGEDSKEERWTSGLFEQSNAKVKEKKNRNRNKYPKGFAKSENSSEPKKVNSSSTLKSPTPELLNKSPNDQIVTKTSKKKRKKTKTGVSEAPEHDDGEPPLKTQKTTDQVSIKSSLGHENVKKSKKQKALAVLRNAQNCGQEAEDKAADSNKNSKSEDSGKANRRKRKKNKGVSDVNEQPAKVKKLTENSTVKDELCDSLVSGSVSQVTPKKRKRNRKKKKNASPETSEDKKPLNESSAQESTPKLTPSKRRRARKKREMERKAEGNPNFKVNKKKKRQKSSHKSEGEVTLKNGILPVEDTEKKDDAASEKDVEESEESCKKRKKERKSLEETVSDQNEDEGNESSSKLNESLETSGIGESPEKSKPKKKKKKVKKDKVPDNQTSPSAQIDVKLVNDKKDDLEPSEETSEVNINNSKGTKKKGLSLREKMEEKLKGARFRFLNEQLYNSKSGDTNKYFLIERDAFKAYHEGYKQQLNQWPVKPIDLIIRSLKKKPANLVIADFGCGDALLSKALPNKVHSFDHVALNDRVTACDMAKTPLSKGSVDIVVFCLSLMGSNLSDYIAEANRVMKMGGLLKIAEVESRFEDVNKFLQLMGKLGFLCTCKDVSNDYFYLFDFRKEKNIKEGKILPSLELRACSYKKR